MKYRQLGASTISLSEIGFGCASYWGKKNFQEKKAIELVHIAVEKGVTLFDTGHSYSNGNAELRLGKALSGISSKIDLCISTKAGTRIASNGRLYNDFSPTWIARSCQQSMVNLNIEQIGVFHLHGPNIEDLNDDLYELLLKLKNWATKN
ncbi:MAG: aldo/keto reductase [Alcanivoracaceae bacterium]|nr:aldo/keto reductase [Alcanivoracaceae bacterium]